MSEENKGKEVFKRIYENYNDMNQMMVREMDMTTEHGGLTGNYREEMWLKFFRSIIPKKFSMAQGVMIIDSGGNVSKEVDIAVYDEQYTPYVFQYNTLKFIPIEAVVVVIECKSKSWDDESLRTWSNQIKKLKSKQSGIARMVSGYSIGLTNGTQTRTRPIRILASINSASKTETLEKWGENLGDAFDFIICQKTNGNEGNNFELQVDNKGKSLNWWGEELNKSGTKLESKDKDLTVFNSDAAKNSVKIDPADYPELHFNDSSELENKLEDLEVPGNPLLTLNLQLNQLLMLLNNPMLFPHFAYAERFKREIGELSKGTNKP
ncbi:DUF6602 domain-containing protein [Sporosarcina limicola]|uniref:DUF6602 domain-containing protein n=1 Tax=Sporosarcina limicola TaxID=34101 RepID=A0A927RDJ8_9BACL|nr:DUF6602 domain-containing protein [Sporosarcina limicola]MBE1555405.1 hypothetical protein [Sporosarcina limicola]